VATGIDGVFLEVHEEPARARSDAQNALALDRLPGLLRQLSQINALVKAAARPSAVGR
jgi:2-dehydro-3-deoxyphosphooctonate aldolase (KDO 8-P synthase)